MRPNLYFCTVQSTIQSNVIKKRFNYWSTLKWQKRQNSQFLIHAAGKNQLLEARAEQIQKKIQFAIFSKTKLVLFSFGLVKFCGQNVKEIDFPTRNASDHFYRDYHLNDSKKLFL